MEFTEMIFIELQVNKIEDGKEDKIVAPVEIAVNKAVIEVDVRVNTEETHDESDKGTVMFPKPFPLMILPTLLMILLRSSG